MTRAAVIRKNLSALVPAPHLLDYAGERRRFSWDAVRAELGTMPGGGINIAWAAVDRHLGTPVRDHVAFRFLGRDAHRNALHNDSRRDIKLGVDIPESDYQKLVTLDDVMGYLGARMGP